MGAALFVSILVRREPKCGVRDRWERATFWAMRLLVNFAMVWLCVIGCSSGWGAEQPQTVTPTEAKRKPIVIDVRTVGEYKAGHLDGVTNVPLAELKKLIPQVAPDKSQPLRVHCQSGGRSARAKTLLQELGYTQVEDLGSIAHARTVLAE